MSDEYISCKTNCPVPVKNVMLGCSGRPVKYQKECSRFKEYMKLLKKLKLKRRMKMFEKEAKERAKDFTDNKERQAAYECGFLDGVDKATEDLKEKLAGAERTRDNLRQLGFPTFQSCKEYADKLNYAKAIIKDLLDNSDEYARQRAINFLKEI